MSTPRTPTITGLTAGAGTSTLAAALHGWDDGVVAGAADVVVCGAGETSLRHAAATVCTSPGPRPVLAVTLDAGTSGRGAWAARLHAVEPRFGAVVLLPHVARWRGLVRPTDEAATVLGQPVEHLPRALRAYAAALRLVVAAMLDSGQLDRTRPPAVIGPRSFQACRGPAPVARPAPIRPVRITAPRRVPPEPVVQAPAGAMPAPVRRILGRSAVAAPPPVAPEPDDDEIEAQYAPAVAERRAC